MISTIDLNPDAVRDHQHHLRASIGLDFTGDQVKDAVQWGQELTKAFDAVGLVLVPKAILSKDQLEEALRIRIKPDGQDIAA